MGNAPDNSLYTSLVDRLAGICGIVDAYYDIFGTIHHTPLKTKQAILSAMGMTLGTAEDISREIREQSVRKWKNILEPVYVVSINQQPLTIPVCLPIPEEATKALSIQWSLTDEKGRKHEQVIDGGSAKVSGTQTIDGEPYVSIKLMDTAKREIGYYLLSLCCSYSGGDMPGSRVTVEKHARVIITPDTCYMPSALVMGRAWGLSVNLYAIRSERNWGVGDFTDLGNIVQWVTELAGSFVGINPLHTLQNREPYGVSPYMPVSRLYRNFIYLDVMSIPDVTESEDAQNIMRSERFSDELRILRGKHLIDYEKVARLKRQILEKAFDHFYKHHLLSQTKRGSEFMEYCSEEGGALESFALYQALGEELQRSDGLFSWKEWPEAYRRPHGDAVRQFGESGRRAILFHQYLQWLIEGQLAAVAEATRSTGMAIGLYHDLAVGSISGGCDVWNNQQLFVHGISVGAPPDDFSIQGQDWGFHPMHPERLKESGYEFFIQMLRKNMRHAGALRIDHALGLFRLFWIPSSMSPKEGAYVEYPAEDLIRIIALESVRNKTLVIAEDLGTIGDAVREMLHRFNMLSYRLFYFERNYPDASFALPEQYPEKAVCAVTTHDLPTLYGYWAGQDITVRKKLGMYIDGSRSKQQFEEREQDKVRILSALKAVNLLPAGCPADAGMIPAMRFELSCAIYGYLAKTPCRLVIVSLDDIIGTLDQQNLPGTINEHPNWMQKTPVSLEEMVSDSRLSTLADIFRRLRRTIDK